MYNGSSIIIVVMYIEVADRDIMIHAVRTAIYVPHYDLNLLNIKPGWYLV